MVRIFWPESRLKFEFDYRVVMTIKGKSEFTTLENNNIIIQVFPRIYFYSRFGPLSIGTGSDFSILLAARRFSWFFEITDWI